jgi:DNA polymerase-3 subunit alpha
MDFCVRLGSVVNVGPDGKKGPSVINRRVVENLVRCGAFDSFSAAKPALHRARFFANAEFALKRAAEIAREKTSAQTTFIDVLDASMDSKVTDDDLLDCPRWSPSECFRLELELLGMYLTGHPLGAYEHIMKDLSTFSIGEPPDVPFMHEVHADRQVKVPVRLGGLLKSCQVRMSKPKGLGGEPKPWAILEIDDSHAVMEALAFAASYESMRGWMPSAVGAPVLLCGELVHRTNRDTREEEEGIQFLVREAYGLADGIATFSNCLYVCLRYDDPDVADKLQKVRAAVEANPGSLPVHVRLGYKDGTTVTVALEGGARPTEAMLSEIGKIAEKEEWGLDVKPDIFAAPPANRWAKPRP